MLSGFGALAPTLRGEGRPLSFRNSLRRFDAVNVSRHSLATLNSLNNGRTNEKDCRSIGGTSRPLGRDVQVAHYRFSRFHRTRDPGHSLLFFTSALTNSFLRLRLQAV